MHGLFLTTRANRPSHRFRVKQILPAWSAAGHTAEVAVLARSSVARWWNYRHWSHYDFVFVQQRTFHSWELATLRLCVKRLVYDVDDAVMFDPEGRRDQRRWDRFRSMIRYADLVICGNQYLAEICQSLRRRAIVIPTAIDTERFHPAIREQRSPSSPVVIGWTGSRSTARYLNLALPAIGQLPPDKVRVKLISDRLDGADLSVLNDVPYEFVPWTPETEVAETASFDIGLMPVPDNPFTQGKCGCKALQYMALGIPPVVSPVGVNSDIVRDGENGFLADSTEAWRRAMQQLMNDPDLRTRLGQAGRQTVEAGYSIARQGQRMVQTMEQLRRAA